MIKLPRRKHTGCDPMCDECMAWMYRVIELTKPVTREAMKVFWETVASSFPQVLRQPVSNFSGWYEIIEQEVGGWVVDSLPEPTVRVTPPGRPTKKRYDPVAVYNDADAEWQPFKATNLRYGKFTRT